MAGNAASASDQAAMGMAPIARQTLNELAYARLKRALLSGRIEPGTTLTLRQLALQLGTSVMPVREAVTRLSAENALEVLPQRGIVLPALAPAAAEEIWSLRLTLEGEACALAARRVDATALESIRALATAVERAAEARDLHGVLESNSDFQFAIYQAADSPLRLQLIEVLRMKSAPHCTAAIRTMLHERPPYYAECWRNHAALVEALAAGDASAAKRIKRHDLRGLRALVDEVGGRRP
jgi:DNA-binding GntR family transcriptional regulator